MKNFTILTTGILIGFLIVGLAGFGYKKQEQIKGKLMLGCGSVLNNSDLDNIDVGSRSNDCPVKIITTAILNHQ